MATATIPFLALVLLAASCDRGTQASPPATARSSAPMPAPAVPSAGAADAGEDAALADSQPPRHPLAFCDRRPQSCSFSGKISEVRADSVVDPRANAGRTATTGMTLLLDADAATKPCPALAGLRRSDADGPIEQTSRPTTREIFIALPENGMPPLTVARGKHVCGAIQSYTAGYDDAYAATLFSDGTLVLAFSSMLPRAESPLADWTFRRGPEKSRERTDEDYWLTTYDVQVGNKGRSVAVSARGWQVADFPDGKFVVQASAYHVDGKLPVWARWMGRNGYAFVLMRDPR